MAELNASPAKNDGKKPLRKPQSLRVDLTAMVDLAFLLVTFFMLTTTLSKPKAMDLAMPVDAENQAVAQSRTVTLCLGADNKVLLYRGLPGNTNVEVIDYGREGLRKALLSKQQLIKQQTGKPMLVILKPSNHSKYGNLIDALDELNITQNKQYAIVDIDDKDVDMLKQQSIY
ncbi:ExbD/TolR family protein [Mucilaginibacter aquatilis]|uniref:Biopolymer transporter ExbD n=1 Tax=Mucilaginibacter aquatilis TaxID=1517760 RepID=A0A6I4I3Y4_9SPHI|nr:biopolymer transporter ExbD [Mucilaginibacter aquatilis]MVN89855.1 biopolymer transporter ExbD [Mucilaginibacter aquatilis]